MRRASAAGATTQQPAGGPQGVGTASAQQDTRGPSRRAGGPSHKPGGGGGGAPITIPNIIKRGLPIYQAKSEVEAAALAACGYRCVTVKVDASGGQCVRDYTSGRIVIVALGALAALLVAGSAIATFTYTNARNEHPAVFPLGFPLGFALGVLLVAYVRHLRERLAGRARKRGAAPVRRPWAGAVAWAAVLLLVGMSLFAAATDYAAATGRGARCARPPRSRTSRTCGSIARRTWACARPACTAPGVHMARCTDPEAAYKFRYERLKLVLQSGGLYCGRWASDTVLTFSCPRRGRPRTGWPSSSRAASRSAWSSTPGR